MPRVAFVMSPAQSGRLRELAQTLQYELDLQAIPSSIHTGGFPAQRADRVYILLDPRDYIAIEGTGSLPDQSVLNRTVFLCAKPIHTDSADDQFHLLKRPGAVFVLDPISRTTLARLGVKARLLRPGYSRSLDHYVPDASRPIDAVFLGEPTARRARYLGAVTSLLSRRNCLLDIAATNVDAEDADAELGEARWRKLVQSKILICLHDGEDVRFEWRQAVDAIHAGAVVVTEHSSSLAPLVPGEHLLAASADSLPFVIDALLNDEQWLASLRISAYERLRTWVPFALPISVLRAAVIEMVGEPLIPDAYLGRRTNREE